MTPEANQVLGLAKGYNEQNKRQSFVRKMIEGALGGGINPQQAMKINKRLAGLMDVDTSLKKQKPPENDVFKEKMDEFMMAFGPRALNDTSIASNEMGLSGTQIPTGPADMYESPQGFTQDIPPEVMRAMNGGLAAFSPNQRMQQGLMQTYRPPVRMMANGGNIGLRQFNPLNIRTGSSVWEGAVPLGEGNETGYENFANALAGLRAGDKTLRTYGKKHGINTIRGAIDKFAPASDNPESKGFMKHEDYINMVSSALGVDPDDKIDLTDPSVRDRILPVMAKIESQSDITQKDIDEARVSYGDYDPDIGDYFTPTSSADPDAATPPSSPVDPNNIDPNSAYGQMIRGASTAPVDPNNIDPNSAYAEMIRGASTAPVDTSAIEQMISSASNAVGDLGANQLTAMGLNQPAAPVGTPALDRMVSKAGDNLVASLNPPSRAFVSAPRNIVDPNNIDPNLAYAQMMAAGGAAPVGTPALDRMVSRTADNLLASLNNPPPVDPGSPVDTSAIEQLISMAPGAVTDPAVRGNPMFGDLAAYMAQTDNGPPPANNVGQYDRAPSVVTNAPPPANNVGQYDRSMLAADPSGQSIAPQPAPVSSAPSTGGSLNPYQVDPNMAEAIRVAQDYRLPTKEDYEEQAITSKVKLAELDAATKRLYYNSDAYAQEVKDRGATPAAEQIEEVNKNLRAATVAAEGPIEVSTAFNTERALTTNAGKNFVQGGVGGEDFDLSTEAARTFVQGGVDAVPGASGADAVPGAGGADAVPGDGTDAPVAGLTSTLTDAASDAVDSGSVDSFLGGLSQKDLLAMAVGFLGATSVTAGTKAALANLLKSKEAAEALKLAGRKLDIQQSKVDADTGLLAYRYKALAQANGVTATGLAGVVAKGPLFGDQAAYMAAGHGSPGHDQHIGPYKGQEHKDAQDVEAARMAKLLNAATGSRGSTRVPAATGAPGGIKINPDGSAT